jgi:hypothetical protein
MKPVINSISPATGPSGALAKINGTGFGGTQGNSTVTVDGVAVKPTSWSDTAISITIPQGSPHDAVVVVNVGGNESNATPFNQRAA